MIQDVLSNRIASRIWLVCATLAAGLGLIGQLGRVSASADAVNYLTHLWFWIGVASSVLLMAGRNSRFRHLGIAAAAVLAVTGGLNLVRAAPSATRQGAVALRLVQFNVAKFNHDPSRAAAWIVAQDAQIVVLQELAGEGGARIRTLLRPAYPYSIDCLGHDGRCSTVILSRQRPLRSGGLARGDPENRQALSAAWATFADAGGAFTVVGVHLGRPWPYGDQTDQLIELRRFVSRADPHRLILSGDFNLPPATFAMQRQDRALGIPRLTGDLATWPVVTAQTGAPGRTWPLPMLVSIDHVYAGEGWQPVDVQRGPDLGSDHRPLVVALANRPGDGRLVKRDGPEL